MKLYWNFWRGGWFKVKNHPWWRFGYFLEPHIISELSKIFQDGDAMTRYVGSLMIWLESANNLGSQAI